MKKTYLTGLMLLGGFVGATNLAMFAMLVGGLFAAISAGGFGWTVGGYIGWCPVPKKR